MAKLILTPILLLGFAMALRSSAAQTVSDCASLVDKAFEVTGEKQQIRESAQFGAMDAENARSWGADPVVIAHLNEIRRPDIMLRDLEDAFAHNCDSGMLQGVIATMGTPLGTRMWRMKLAEQNPKNREKRNVFLQGLRLHPPSNRRYDLLTQIDDATETSESAWDMLLAMVKATHAKVGSDFAAQHQKYKPYLRAAAMNDLVFIYRNVDDSELSEYLGMLKTPAYQKFNHTLNQSLVATFLVRTEQVMHEVSKGEAASKPGSRP